MFYTLVHRCFTLCSDWLKFHREFMTFKEIFQRNGYPKSVLDKCFRKFLDRLHIMKPTSATVEKALHLALPYLGPTSLLVRTKIRNAMKNTLNHCKTSTFLRKRKKLLICSD